MTSIMMSQVTALIATRSEGNVRYHTNLRYAPAVPYSHNPGGSDARVLADSLDIRHVRCQFCKVQRLRMSQQRLGSENLVCLPDAWSITWATSNLLRRWNRRLSFVDALERRLPFAPTVYTKILTLKEGMVLRVVPSNNTRNVKHTNFIRMAVT